MAEIIVADGKINTGLSLARDSDCIHQRALLIASGIAMLTAQQVADDFC